jgi:cysteinyl-tRNA synthetase
MLYLFNTFGRKIEPFSLPRNKVVTIFTCGPSVYQRAHIGNFRTFLFEDILLRYLEYSGYRVDRGMAVTDIEDKAVREAEQQRTTVKDLTDRNIIQFVAEMRRLGMKVPDYMPRASECVGESVEIIRRLMEKKVAYRHDGNIYFDPLRFRGFGKLFGLDMSLWPKKRRRFHKDTYPGIHWNYGDFILWHGCNMRENVCWDTSIGRGRPAWNVQDPSMVMKHFNETLSIFCGGIDNLYRHHDYSLAVLEAIRPYPMARFWMHGGHLYVDGKKMSKSRGNIYYTDTLLGKGFTVKESRFFLMYGHYRDRLNYSDRTMTAAAEELRTLRKCISKIRKAAGTARPSESSISRGLKDVFSAQMDNDLRVKEAFDGMQGMLQAIDLRTLPPSRAAGITKALLEVDEVLRVMF